MTIYAEGEPLNGANARIPTPAPAPHYKPQDLDKVRAVNAWLTEHEKSRAWLARKVRASSGTVSQVLTLKYPSPPTDYLDAMLATLQVETARLEDGLPGYVEGGVHRLVQVVCDRTRKHAGGGVLTGSVGVGKTRTLREYQRRHPQTLMVEANPSMTAGTMMTALLTQLHAPIPPGLDAKFDALVAALEGTNYLVILDEAELMSPKALEYARRLRDKGRVGFVLSGTTKLHALLKPEHGQFDQWRSRISMWPATIERITRDDADEIARDALRDSDGKPMDIADDVLDALWAYGQGSARVLTEGMVPALRDYVLGKDMELTAKLVDQVAQKVLFMPPRRAA